VPKDPIDVSLIPDTTNFKINVTRSHITGGVALKHIEISIVSYDSDGKSYSTVKTYDISEDAKQYILSAAPPLSITSPSEVRAKVCNHIGCSKLGLSVWNIGLDAQNTISILNIDKANGNVTYNLVSKPEILKSKPHSIKITWYVKDDVAVNKTLSWVEQEGHARRNTFSIVYAELLINEHIILPYAGQIAYVFESQNCVLLASKEICSNPPVKIGETPIYQVPLLPSNNGDAPIVSIPSLGGALKIEFKQPAFWGINSVQNGRKIKVKIFEQNSSIVEEIFLTNEPGSTLNDYLHSSQSSGFVRNLVPTKKYKFQLSAINGVVVSTGWSKTSKNWLSPIVTPPDAPIILPFTIAEQVFSEYAILKIRKSYVNGDDVKYFKVFAAELSQCGLLSVQWNAAMRFNISDANAKIFSFRYEGLKPLSEYVFKVTAINSAGEGLASTCCEKKDIIKTPEILRVVRISPPKKKEENRCSSPFIEYWEHNTARPRCFYYQSQCI
jgi:hypothetical protein